MSEKKRFSTTDTGYNPIEVDTYIEKLEALINKERLDNRELKEISLTEHETPPEILKRVEKMENELEGYHEIEDSLKEALEAAHVATQKIQKVVEEESRKILYDANKNADIIVNEALSQSISALNYIKQMRTDARVFQKRFKILVEEQDKLATDEIWEEILAPIDSYKIIELETIQDVIQKNEDESKK